jgi:predicted amidophosphoribosyltransferase
MTPNNTSDSSLRTVYCPNCHLATPANRERCLHCGKPVRQRDQTQRATAHPNQPRISTSQIKRGVAPRSARVR